MPQLTPLQRDIQAATLATGWPEGLDPALDELPAYHRWVIVMREVYGMSYEEMAEAMDVSKGTIMSRLFHARRKLQRSLAACYERTFQEKAPREEETE